MKRQTLHIGSRQEKEKGDGDKTRRETFPKRNHILNQKPYSRTENRNVRISERESIKTKWEESGESGESEERQKEDITGISNLVVVHQPHYTCECRWICIDDLFCFLNTLRCGSPGVESGCVGEFAVVVGVSSSPLRLSTVPFLVGSVRLRRILPPTDCTGLPGVSATGDSSSLVIPSVRAPCMPCFSVIVLLLTIRVGCVVPTSFQLSPSASSSDDEIVSSSSSAPTPLAGGGVMSSMNQSWCAIKNSRTS